MEPGRILEFVRFLEFVGTSPMPVGHFVHEHRHVPRSLACRLPCPPRPPIPHPLPPTRSHSYCPFGSPAVRFRRTFLFPRIFGFVGISSLLPAALQLSLTLLTLTLLLLNSPLLPVCLVTVPLHSTVARLCNGLPPYSPPPSFRAMPRPLLPTLT